jgi:YHS domain-containing protein
MDLVIAVVLSVAFALVSTGVGMFLMRYRASVTEMTGMMVGMTLGMMAGIAIGFYIGAATDMFISNLVGVSVGVAFGAVFGRVGGLMGAMDGSMGGFMGGMMGAMLGVMVNIGPMQVWVTAGFTTLICLAVYVGLIRLVQKASAADYARDPVCNMMVYTRTATLTSQYLGETVYFCAAGCKRDFDLAPERHLVQSLRQLARDPDAVMPG